MLHTYFSNHPDPNEKDWISSEILRHTMAYRRFSMIVAILLVIVIAGVMQTTVNRYHTLAWLLFSLITLASLQLIKKQFHTKYTSSTIEKQIAFEKKYFPFWLINAVSWGIVGWTFFCDMPQYIQYFIYAVLSLVAYVSVLNLSVNRKLAVQFINVYITTQIAYGMWFIGIERNFEVPLIFYAHFAGLVTVWLFCIILINRLNKSFISDCKLNFKNYSLIQSLERQTKQLEQEKKSVETANATIKRFYSSAAHDIRQPVYALNVYADIVVDEPHRTLELAPKFKQACNAVDALFRSLFDFEKIHAGEVKVNLEYLDLNRLFLDIQKHYQPRADAKKIELRVLPAKGFVLADHSILKGILYHLVSNAIKYTNNGGVLVAFRKKSDKLSLKIWDTGIGISPSNHAHIIN
jgi:signal transduction histidine kinase